MADTVINLIVLPPIVPSVSAIEHLLVAVLPESATLKTRLKAAESYCQR